jgi:hypothetical protein
LNSRLQTRVNLERNVGAIEIVSIRRSYHHGSQKNLPGPLVVLAATLLDRAWHLVGDVVWSLDDVDVQTLGHVEGDVAMEWPDTWVILLVLDDSEGVEARNWASTEWTKTESVTNDSAGWVGDSARPVSETRSKDIEVVSVKMHRMGKGPPVAHVDTDSLGGYWERVDVPVVLVGPVAGDDVVKQVDVHVGTEAGVVDGPHEVGAIVHKVEVKEDVVNIRLSIKRNWAQSRRAWQRVVTASVALLDGERGGGGRNRVLISTLVVDSSDSLGRDTIGERATLTARGVTSLSTEEPAGSRGGSSVDNDIRSLTDGQVDVVLVVWNNGLEVVGNDGEVVSIKSILDEGLVAY